MFEERRKNDINWPYEDRRKNDLTNNLYLDPTILQSRTTLTLVAFIDELWEVIDEGALELEYLDSEYYMKIKNRYHDIKAKAEKAKDKRSIKL